MLNALVLGDRTHGLTSAVDFAQQNIHKLHDRCPPAAPQRRKSAAPLLRCPVTSPTNLQHFLDTFFHDTRVSC